MQDLIIPTKICCKCKKEKYPDEFGTRKRNSDGKRGRCKLCEIEDRKIYLTPEKIEMGRVTSRKYLFANREEVKRKQKIWCEKNKERRYKWQRNNQLKKRYNISLEEYHSLLLIQEGKCKICKTTTPGRKRKGFMVDHCHKTGIVRGLLCVQCNLAIGQFNDNPEIVKIAAKYLELNGKI